MVGRLVLLVPIALCIAVLLISNDMTVRLLAIIALIVLEQVREWLVFSQLKVAKEPTNKNNKP
jgi:hypothetical protein